MKTKITQCLNTQNITKQLKLLEISHRLEIRTFHCI